ncbi:uncharacterized protein LOC124462540 isoform X2 [Hypomesus transpacificus]|uniref:uncharacterized protein LOC124462540 isoform X2 n=1 Tax=Hypomesus transpacificus TaxID=137520 RepID=UPI001F08124A|nr:uncharacterized protein LOC124462540 isoform X2 [Hypomesus transpacificus]
MTDHLALSKVLWALGELKEEVQALRQETVQMRAEMKMLGTKSKSGSNDPQTISRPPVSLPLTTFAMLEEMEQMLLSEVERQKLTTYYTVLGGHTAKDFTRRLLMQTFTNSFASSLNWAGKGIKTGLKSTKVQDCMFYAVRKLFPGQTHAEFYDTVKRWLRYAPERDGGKGRKRAGETNEMNHRST